MQFICSSVDESSFTSTVSEIKFCKSAEFSEIIKNTFTRLTDWEKVKNNKLSNWLKIIIDNDNNTEICCRKINYICKK